MNELILHHYPMSPFAEKVRLMLGFKQLAWRSVLIPPVMPKPDVVALSGGYRKTPILQIGADVYCDTALIARVLEARQPQPTLYPNSAPLAAPLAQWADGTLFAAAVSWAMQPAGVAAILGEQPPEVLKAFAADRAAMRANAPRPTLADATAQLKQHLSAIAAQLQQGGPWLFGAAPCIADFSAGHCLWFIRLARPVAHLLDDYPPIGPWLDRLFAFGHHNFTTMSSTEALAVAAGADAHAPVAVEPGLGFEAGQAVTVAATDYGVDPVAGTLVGLSPQETVLRRTDARAGTVHVHFPRFGFQLKADKT
ncbi:MAG: glutathione S-transferase family protein [Rubrivivax sp.]